MDCAECKIKMAVTHSVRVSGETAVARHTCPRCNAVCTSIAMVIYRDPQRGQGAIGVAKKMQTQTSGLQKIRDSIDNLLT